MTRSSGCLDAATLEVMRHAIASVAEEMNANLVRTAYSPNIKERRDCSSAIFDLQGQMVAQAESIPVHLGAMPYSVAAAIEAAAPLEEGDVVVVNDPYAGGAHLPDITFVAPVVVAGEVVAYVANRAHHADVGGKEPGSLAGDAEEIYQEGLRIPPVRLWRRGDLCCDLQQLLLANVRTPDERWGDLRAQKAACATGIRRWTELCDQHGVSLLRRAMEEILAYSERRMAQAIAELPDGVAEFEDALDDDGIGQGIVPVRVRIEVYGERIRVDFHGTAHQVAGPINAVYAVTASATFFAVRAFTDPEIPSNAGCYRPIDLVVPKGSVVNALLPAAVVGGNLETSQRIVDVILGALGRLVPERAIAASQGSMNNVALGGIRPHTGTPFTLYETIAGGVGASAAQDGADGVQSHMTNTMNTPVEALETAYPLRVEQYTLRPGTGGKGTHRGGMGIQRDLLCLAPSARASLLTDRRITQPYGMAGGGAGSAGQNILVRNGEEIVLPGKGTVRLQHGDRLSIRTPGGGGYGPPVARSRELSEADAREERT